MSGRPPGRAWQRPDLANSFLDSRRTLIPLLEIQEDLIRRLLLRHDRPVRRFLDVGSGDGAMSELVLSVAPESEAVLVDFSRPMLERAHRRLERFSDRWRVVEGDLDAAAWHQGLPAGGYDLVVSAFAIHHLPARRKRELFGELFALLAPGALLLNMDYVLVTSPLRGVFDEQMVVNLVRAEQERGGPRSAEQVQQAFMEQKDAHEDRPDTAEDQVRWLSAAGFDGAEVYFKWADAAVFGAVKPGIEE
jgi:tRNA (cmo5U34)-methyltransferase